MYKTGMVFDFVMVSLSLSLSLPSFGRGEKGIPWNICPWRPIDGREWESSNRVPSFLSSYFSRNQPLCGVCEPVEEWFQFQSFNIFPIYEYIKQVIVQKNFYLA